MASQNKGKVLSLESLEAERPRLVAKWRARKWSDERIAGWIAAQNAKWAVVATCTLCVPEHPLIREEVVPHTTKHLASPRARVLAAMMLADKTTQADIDAALAAVRGLTCV
jgi:hypothetical protein